MTASSMWVRAMKTDIEALVLAGRLLLELAYKFESEGKTEDARKMYLRAIRQGLFVQELRSRSELPLVCA